MPYFIAMGSKPHSINGFFWAWKKWSPTISILFSMSALLEHQLPTPLKVSFRLDTSLQNIKISRIETSKMHFACMNRSRGKWWFGAKFSTVENWPQRITNTKKGNFIRENIILYVYTYNLLPPSISYASSHFCSIL